MRWAAPPIIASANQGRGSAVLNRMVQDTGSAVPLARVLERRRHFSGAVLLAGLLHLAIVLLICLHDPASTGRGSSPRPGLERWANPVLMLPSFAFLALTVQRGSIQDYYLYLEMWREVRLGHDPWFFAYGVFGKYPLNAYGPLFNVFAIPALVNPLLPKLLFAGAYLVFAVWLIKDRGKDWLQGGLVWPLLVVWFWVPYCWVEIANFGHFDVLVGLFCVAAVEARVRQRDVVSGVCLGLGVLLKFMPIVLLPFLILDRGRPRYRLLSAAVVAIALGLGASVLLWGPSTFRPLIFVAERQSLHLSIYRFLKGRYSPLGWLDFNENPDQAAPAFMLMALLWAWLLVRKRMIEPAPAAVLAVLVTLMFYQVGFAQYHMVLFVLASYWMMMLGERSERRSRSGSHWVATSDGFRFSTSSSRRPILIPWGCKNGLGCRRFFWDAFFWSALSDRLQSQGKTRPRQVSPWRAEGIERPTCHRESAASPPSDSHRARGAAVRESQPHPDRISCGPVCPITVDASHGCWCAGSFADTGSLVPTGWNLGFLFRVPFCRERVACTTAQVQTPGITTLADSIFFISP